MRSSCVVIQLVLKGLQTLLLEVWECPVPLGVQKSPLITLFNVGSAKEGRRLGRIPHVSVVYLPDALYPEGWAEMSYGVTSSWGADLFAFHMCVVALHGVGYSRWPDPQGPMRGCRCAFSGSESWTYPLLNQGQIYNRVRHFLSRTQQLFSRSAGDTLKSVLDIMMLLRACANVRFQQDKTLQQPQWNRLMQQDGASEGSNPVQSTFAEDQENCVSQSSENSFGWA